MTIQPLQKNVDLFAWAPVDMPKIDPDKVCHHLTIKFGFKSGRKHKEEEDMPKIDLDTVCHHLTIKFEFKPVGRRKHKEEEDRSVAISEEVTKLKEAEFI